MPIHRTESGVAPSKAKLVEIGDSYPGDIPVGSTSTEIYTPPVGVMWEVLTMVLMANANFSATTGIHSFEIIGNHLHAKLQGASLYNSHLRWHDNMWVYADHSQRPTTEVGAILALNKVYADCNNPLIVMYYNGTDAIQTGTISIYFTLKETPII